MRNRLIFVRNTNAPELIEMFLVASAASVLGIRGFLAAAGYPQIGGGGLHIAHMLWGGLFMLLALLLLFSSLGQISLRLSAILGGIGFGTFIDELGKFITSDHNYFFSPTVGLIYIIFIAIFLVMRVLVRRRAVSHNAALANALNRLELIGSRPIGRSKRNEILALLRNAHADDPLAQTLREYIDSADASHSDDPGIYMRSRERLLRAYERIALNRYFIGGIVAAADSAVRRADKPVPVHPVAAAGRGHRLHWRRAACVGGGCVDADPVRRLAAARIAPQRLPMVPARRACGHLHYADVRFLRDATRRHIRAVHRNPNLHRPQLHDRVRAAVAGGCGGRLAGAAGWQAAVV